MLKVLRHRLERALTRLALHWVPRWSRQTVCRVARILGHWAATWPLYSRHVARANLDLAYGDQLTAREKKRLRRTAYQTFALVLLDIFWFTRDTRARVQQWVQFDEGLAAELFQPRRHVCVTAHLGNWELLGHAVSLRGYPLHSVAAPLVNPSVEPYFARTRIVSGQVIIPQSGAIRQLLRLLKQEAKIGLLLDQNTKPSRGGRFVDFFGLPAPVSEAGALLAIQMQADILFGFCIPGRDGRYRVHSAAPIRPGATEFEGMTKEEQATQLTQRIATTIESAIRQHPGAWLWMYKRWKYVAPGRSRAEYPFYAKPRQRPPLGGITRYLRRPTG